METKRKFIMRFGITVCLLAILFLEGLFLYCRYVKHTSISQYAVEKLQLAQKWISHSGAQTANAKTPASRELTTVKSITPNALPFQTAADFLQEMIREKEFIIPEKRHAGPVSSNSGTEADPAYPTEETPPKEDPEAATASPSPKPKKTKAKAAPAEAMAADSTGLDVTNIHELVERQAAAGIKPNMEGRIQLEAESILQYPELPTGCEVTSLTMALRFAGYDVSKEELADQFLDKAAPGTVSYKTAFWGDPRQADSFGCYAPVIVKAANKYLANQESEKTAYNLTGASLDDLLAEVRMGYPVIVWGSMYIDEEIVFSYGWDIDGETVTWPSNEHCMLLIGFDTANNSVIVCDPLSGIVSYDKNAFQRHYDTLEKQAIVIY